MHVFTSTSSDSDSTAGVASAASRRQCLPRLQFATPSPAFEDDPRGPGQCRALKVDVLDLRMPLQIRIGHMHRCTDGVPLPLPTCSSSSASSSSLVPCLSLPSRKQACQPKIPLTQTNPHFPFSHSTGRNSTRGKEKSKCKGDAAEKGQAPLHSDASRHQSSSKLKEEAWHTCGARGGRTKALRNRRLDTAAAL